MYICREIDTEIDIHIYTNIQRDLHKYMNKAHVHEYTKMHDSGTMFIEPILWVF